MTEMGESPLGELLKMQTFEISTAFQELHSMGDQITANMIERGKGDAWHMEVNELAERIMAHFGYDDRRRYASWHVLVGGVPDDVILEHIDFPGTYSVKKLYSKKLRGSDK